MRKEIYHFNDHLHSHSYGLYFHKIAIETVKSEMTRLNEIEPKMQFALKLWDKKYIIFGWEAIKCLTN